MLLDADAFAADCAARHTDHSLTWMATAAATRVAWLQGKAALLLAEAGLFEHLPESSLSSRRCAGINSLTHPGDLRLVGQVAFVGSSSVMVHPTCCPGCNAPHGASCCPLFPTLVR